MIGQLPLFTAVFLRRRWADEYVAYRGSPEEKQLLERLQNWATRVLTRETSSSAAFIDVFFKQTWGYVASGQRAVNDGYNLYPEFRVVGAGQTGGTGAADLALGWFGRADVPANPQALCEFKDVRSGLDAPQRRKGNDRSPVQQCGDYLREASRGLFGSELIRPTWAIVTDMNEFRLYWRDRMPSQYQSFIVTRGKKDRGTDTLVALVDDTEEAAFARFLFSRLFHRDLLLSTADRPELERLIQEQGVHERELESDFYREYQDYRETVFQALAASNPGFKGTRGKLVRFAQRFLDRCIFILFCEDMGSALRFPPHLLRDLLIARSCERHYSPDDTSTWHDVKRLFRAMRDGTPFGDTRINRFNGGLFNDDPELENLNLPNSIFCMKNQGADPERWTSSPRTLLFFSARYNFGVQATGERSIGLYTLGRIFEQSITDLEFMEAKADNRPSLTELSKRKRDGVYYTPEWVTYFIVRNTVGAQLEELRVRGGVAAGRNFSQEELDRYQRMTSGKKKLRKGDVPPAAVAAYLAKLDTYERDVADLKILDPACGSGAFLIQAMNELVSVRKWIAHEREQITGTASLLDQDVLVKDVLSRNIYGVDINPESVEIARLALWLHTTIPDRPLSVLDHTIRCGNSLVGADFYSGAQKSLFSEEEKERINVFDWEKTFPEVFGRNGGKSGFDCVIGNPPYVKLQNLRQVDGRVADYLLRSKKTDGTPIYNSTQTGNFDLYLPFIEKGIRLLNRAGYMGFIAPSVWLVNEYGAGLRSLVCKEQSLERWVDFKDFQVFPEAITYTALQFFRGSAVEKIACVFSPYSPVGAVDWSLPEAEVDYDELGTEQTWILAPDLERQLLVRLRETCSTLEDASVGIMVGIQTSADLIFHLKRVSPGRYRSFSEGKAGEEVEIEDAVMRPLVSGTHVKRYLAPITDVHLLFTYDDTTRPVALIDKKTFKQSFPKAWRYLTKHEESLRAREGRKMDRDDAWWGYNYPKNLDKQRLAKLLIPRMTIELAVACDPEGSVTLDNVDANGVLALDEGTLWYLCGVLNGPVANYAWKRGSKPFQNGFRGANKQFLSALPIPRASESQRAKVGEIAQVLHSLHSARRDDIRRLEQRLNDCAAAQRGMSWIWEDVGTVESWKELNPKKLTGRALSAWAKDEVARRVAARQDELKPRLGPGARLEAHHGDGALWIESAGVELLRVYVSPVEEDMLFVQWDWITRSLVVAGPSNVTKVVTALLDLRMTSNAALRKQIVALHQQILRQDREIIKKEAEMVEVLYKLYALTPAERALVEG